jgi:hypothetical protein
VKAWLSIVSHGQMHYAEGWQHQRILKTQDVKATKKALGKRSTWNFVSVFPVKTEEKKSF